MVTHNPNMFSSTSFFGPGTNIQNDDAQANMIASNPTTFPSTSYTVVTNTINGEGVVTICDVGGNITCFNNDDNFTLNIVSDEIVFENLKNASGNNYTDNKTKMVHPLPGYTLYETIVVNNTRRASIRAAYTVVLSILLVVMCVTCCYYHFIAKDKKAKNWAFFCYIVTLVTILILLTSPYLFGISMFKNYCVLPTGINHFFACLVFLGILIAEIRKKSP